MTDEPKTTPWPQASQFWPAFWDGMFWGGVIGIPFYAGWVLRGIVG
jgi:hypothetical protein